MRIRPIGTLPGSGPQLPNGRAIMTSLQNPMRAMFQMLLGVSCVLASILGVTTAVAAPRPPSMGREMRDFALTELGGSTVRLSDYTKRGPVVLVVLRGYPGYQCPICSRQFGEFLSDADELKQAGSTTLFVYPGPSDELAARAAEFVKGKDYPDHFRILLDPDYAFINANGLRWNAPNETSYPSTFVIDGKRKVRYARISHGHGDRAPVGDVLKSLGMLGMNHTKDPKPMDDAKGEH